MPPQYRYNYRRNLPHIQRGRRVLFLTFSTYRRWILPAAAKQIALECCLDQNGVSAEVHSVVVMPDHVHLLLTPMIGPDSWEFPLAEIMRRIKGRSAWRINHLLQREGKVWQEESFDHVLRSNDSLAEKVDYICENPIRAGLVKNESDYPWLWRGTIPVI